jgi:hypothetical protein
VELPSIRPGRIGASHDVDKFDTPEDETALERFFWNPDPSPPRPTIGLVTVPVEPSVYPESAAVVGSPTAVFDILAGDEDCRSPGLADGQYRLAPVVVARGGSPAASCRHAAEAIAADATRPSPARRCVGGRATEPQNRPGLLDLSYWRRLIDHRDHPGKVFVGQRSFGVVVE